MWTTIHSKSPNYAGALQVPPIFALQISVKEMDFGKVTFSYYFRVSSISVMSKILTFITKNVAGAGNS